MPADNESSTGDVPPTAPSKNRRASLADLFRPSDSSSSRPFPSAMAQAQAQPNTRRLSVTTLGLSGSAAQGQQSSPFASVRDRGKSISDMQQQQHRPSSIYENSESAIAEDGDVPPLSSTSPSNGGFHRRLSAGAKAYSDMRRGSGGNSNASPSASGAARPPGSPPGTRREGFNWSDSLRSRAERSSMSAGAGTAANGAAPASTGHVRTPSQTAPSPAAPAPAPPAPKRLSQKPDAFQERILKGDFYMD